MGSYAAWFAAVFASAALFWAWKAFIVQSETLRAQLDLLREQQRSSFLTVLSEEYKRRLEDTAFWIVSEIQVQFTKDHDIKSNLNCQQKLIHYFGMINARKNIREICDLVNSTNLLNYLEMACDYNQRIGYY